MTNTNCKKILPPILSNCFGTNVIVCVVVSFRLFWKYLKLNWENTEINCNWNGNERNLFTFGIIRIVLSNLMDSRSEKLINYWLFVVAASKFDILFYKEKLFCAKYIDVRKWQWKIHHFFWMAQLPMKWFLSFRLEISGFQINNKWCRW